MSVTESTDGTYSMHDDGDDLRAEFDDQFDWDEEDTYQVDSCWCTGSSYGCCV